MTTFIRRVSFVVLVVTLGPLAVFEGRAQTPPTSSSSLQGTTWQLVRFQGSDDTTLTPDDRAKYTIEFGAGGHLTARIDCNRGRGTWKSTGSSQLELGPLALTRAKCPDGSLHDHIVKQWGYIRSHVIRDGHLFLALMADGGIYEFEPLARSSSGSGQDTRARNLEIYWIDVEGGAATLFVSPTGESLLFDTGFPGNGDRDAKRIHAAAQKAGLKQIDHVVISHWHGDHVGGLEALAKMIPMGRFYDHGNGVEETDRPLLDTYKAIAGNKRTIVKAGDTIPFGGVQLRVLVSEGPVIANPINGGGPNPLCATATRMPPAGPENIRMVGLSLTYGTFKFASLADLDWSREMELACPVNKLGAVNLYTINRHGGLDNSGNPALLSAIKPQVIVVNNGPRKGLGGRDDRIKPISVPGVTPAPYERISYLRMAKTPGVEDIWQGHLSMLDSDPAHNTARDMIANFEDNGVDHPGNLIMASVGRDGRFTLTNTRNGFSKTYTAHP